MAQKRNIPVEKNEYGPVFPVLCVVLALVIFTSMPIYQKLEGEFSEERGLGAAMVMLREGIEKNESVSAFLGLTDGDRMQNDTDLAVAVAAYIEEHAPPVPEYMLPLDGALNSAHGTRINPFYTGSMMLLSASDYEIHHGIDISAAHSRSIRAAMGGVVSWVGYDPDGYGNYLILRHDDCDTLYAHCEKIFVTAGQRVEMGDEIALAGMTGRATGIHLHFEVLVDGVSVDPLSRFAFFTAGEAAS